MRFGFSPAQSESTFEAMRNQARLAEASGFETLRAQEHHSLGMMYPHFIIGEASECIEQIDQYARMGIGHIACLMNFGNPDLKLVERSMRLFGERIIPHFAA
jgi:alkanesulfonate monooxygenase SsuD/methylene tetrahydromethanopterin reductase-like flavin-dependent oxidoreductase (luciferase family)